MTLEEKLKWVSAASYEDLLRKLRRAPIGDDFFDSEKSPGVWEAMQVRMADMRSEPGGYERHVLASKTIGWDW